MTLARAPIDQLVVRAIGEVVEVLDADDGCDRLCFRELFRRHDTHAEVPDEALPLQLREHGERLGDRTGGGLEESSDAEVDDVERLESEAFEVLVHGGDQLVTGECPRPGFVGVAARADLRGDVQLVGVGMQRLTDELVDDVGPVVVAGVDVRDPERDRVAQHRDRLLQVLRRSPDFGWPAAWLHSPPG